MAKAKPKPKVEEPETEPVAYATDPAKRRAQVERELEQIEGTLRNWQAQLPQMIERVRSMKALVSGSAPAETDD